MPARIALPESACAPEKAATCVTTMSLLQACGNASRHAVAAISLTVALMSPPCRSEDRIDSDRWSTEDFTKLCTTVTIAAMFEQFIGTKPVEERHRIDVAALAQYSGIKFVSIEQFKGGQSNPTYRLTASDGTRYVLRRKPPGKLLPSAHAVDREFRVIKALYGKRFPVARPHLLCEDDSVIGTAFYLMDYVEGRVLWDQSLPGMSKAERFAIWNELNRVIAELHRIDYRSAGLADFGKPGNYIERQVARWTKQYRASETERVPAMDNLIDWLPKNIPPETGTTIVHGDYRLDNTIFHPGEPRILAVLDW